MSELIGIVGESGSGKSTSLRNLDPASTFIINVAGKPLPIKGYKKNYKPLTLNPETKRYEGNLYNTSDVVKIGQILKIIDKTRPEIKVVILEDCQYIMSFEAMDRASEKGYEKFTQMASNFYSVLKGAMEMREDLKVCVLTHSENTGDVLNPHYKIKTIGKMIDSMITVEGLFTYVFFTNLAKDSDGKMVYQFMTQSDGTNTAKSPMGCFEDMFIDNDLAFVFDSIDKYNNE